VIVSLSNIFFKTVTLELFVARGSKRERLAEGNERSVMGDALRMWD
jgi:hypothetical protein